MKIRIRKTEEIHASGKRWAIELEVPDHSTAHSTTVDEEDGWFPWFVAKRLTDADTILTLIENNHFDISKWDTTDPVNILIAHYEETKDWNSYDRACKLY